MKIPEIKKLVEAHDVATLKQAEEHLIEGEALAIEIGGDDEGEQLTHILAAIAIHEDMDATGADFKTALRNYTQRVRNSIN